MKAEILIIAFLAACLAFYASVVNSGMLAPDSIRNIVQSAGHAGPLLYVAIIAAAVVIAPIPSIPFVFVAGFVWGPLIALGLTVAGATAGALVAFAIARRLGRERVKRRLGRFDRLGLLDSFDGRKGFVAILLLRLVPLFSFDIISYAAGLTNISAKRFASASALGMMPVTAVYTFLGSAALEFNLEFIGVLGLLLLMAFAIAYANKQKLAQATGIDLDRLLEPKDKEPERKA